jgi:hypothetical protein
VRGGIARDGAGAAALERSDRRAGAPVLAVGPFASFETSERLKLTGSQDTSVDVNNLKGTDVGVTFGAGLEIDAGPGRWVIEGRYDSGTVDLNPDGSRSGAWLLMTGFRF